MLYRTEARKQLNSLEENTCFNNILDVIKIRASTWTLLKRLCVIPYEGYSFLYCALINFLFLLLVSLEAMPFLRVVLFSQLLVKAPDDYITESDGDFLFRKSSHEQRKMKIY